jgi:transcriptional regulator with XRE-family HTH domain
MKHICHMTLTKNEVSKLLGSKIRSIRNAKQLTIEKVAFDAGMEYTQLSRIEHGKINTSVYHIYKISKSLEIRMPDLFNDIHK